MSTYTLRRLRKNKIIRDWLSQTQLRLKDIVAPFFVVEGKNIRQRITSMPGIYHFSVDRLLAELAHIPDIPAILLFGLAAKKNAYGSESYNRHGVVQRAVSAIKKRYRDKIIITDVCLCAYTSHGHCGILKSPQSIVPASQRKKKNCALIDNDATIEILAKIAVSHAEAGADFVAPSAMMDGQVKAIRQALDRGGYLDTGILAYSAKYASSFYAPFRQAQACAPSFGDRKTYQMDIRNSDEALREIRQDIAEGADIVMVKPAIAYLDIIYRAKQEFNIPIAAYNVSGEYAMVKHASAGDASREKSLVLEILTAIKRAGADIIITYHAGDLPHWLKP